LFSGHGQLRVWQPGSDLVHQAQTLLDRHIEDRDEVDSLPQRLHLECRAITLLECLLQELMQQLQLAPHPVEAGVSLDKLPLSFKDRVDASLRGHRSLDEIAGALGVSVSTLQRKFKAAYGYTVIDYVRRRRLEIARSALLLDGISIGEAAYLAGYNHPSNFVAAFRKQFDVTPARLVRQHRNRHQPGRMPEDALFAERETAADAE